jgi:hypothetical protein
MPVAVQINPVPLWSCFDCGSTAKPSPSGMLPAQDQLRPYAGYTSITELEFIGSSNYHSLQGTLQRRMSNGLMLGVAYTLSKQLTLGTFDPLLTSAVNRQRNYTGGPATSNLMINYAYNIPSLSKKLGDNTGAKLVGVITDNWALSGITRFALGSSYSPTCSANSYTRKPTDPPGPPLTYDATGSPNESIACQLIGNPLSGRGKLAFNPFTIAPTQTLGNGGRYYLLGPRLQNWDVTIRRFIPLGSDSRRKIRLEAQASNVFNHAEFTGISSSMSFDCSSLIQTGGSTPDVCSAWTLNTASLKTTGAVGSGLGARTTATGNPRALGFNARIEF